MNLIAAPARQFKTYSMWLTIAGGLLNLGMGLVAALSTANVMSPAIFASVNAVLLFAIGAVKFISQQIPVTEDEKIDLVASAAAAPMKTGETNVSVQIAGAVTPATPQAAAVSDAIKAEAKAP